ncbi:hypothetical protein CK203_040075 [Vitis vinifera]|uniref:Uncharacterized protein n=1 Tax=Vitis vinifera TaxID=29760 RepID=A0A438IE13_VITVI|nr:hypothetical protein CK203_040075 [Vitis vinifera]
MCLGRNLRGPLWKEVEVLHCGSGLGVSVCVVCWKEWRYDPKVGCSKNCEQVKEAWMRVVVDENIVAFKELQWARILVKSEWLKWSSSLQVAHWQSAKVAMTCKIGEVCCRKDRKVASSDCVNKRANDKGIKGIVEYDKEKVSVDEPVAQGPVLVSQPSFVALNRARAREGLRDVDCGSLYGDVFGIQMGSSPLVPNLIEITNKALMEEAFKYTDYHPCSLFSLEKRDFSSSSTSSRRDGAIVFIDGGFEQGCVSEEVGVVGLYKRLWRRWSKRVSRVGILVAWLSLAAA